MLYLTYNRIAKAKKLTIVHYCYLEHTKDMACVVVMCGPLVMNSCIVEIDELEACALVLQGEPLFAVAYIDWRAGHSPNWVANASMVNADLVMHWFDNEWNP